MQVLYTKELGLEASTKIVVHTSSWVSFHYRKLHPSYIYYMSIQKTVLPCYLLIIMYRAAQQTEDLAG